MTKRSTHRPVAVFLCVASAAVLAAPTLFFPADSPTEPKLGLLAIGTVLFALGTIRIRTEHATSPIDGDVTGD
ncbi:hypothetical protein QE430_001139 [Microbacterium testaceum]|uniref:hypothetical protein n=1 Tax=Microbacterium sp. che218 TaxID=3140649 RepID=UPI0027884E7F|nr:hypothetical protein [Microbacterium testaceum]